jgi:hypothetical protein
MTWGYREHGVFQKLQEKRGKEAGRVAGMARLQSLLQESDFGLHPKVSGKPTEFISQEKECGDVF